MAALRCDACGAGLSMDESGNFAVCEYCGMKHTKERITVKVQEIKSVVEIAKGEAEKTRLLKNVETYTKLNNYSEAKALCREIVNEYPSDWSCWWKFANIIMKEIEETKTIKIKNDAFETPYNLLEIYLSTLRVCTEDESNDITSQWEDFWKNIAQGIIDGNYIVSNWETFAVKDNAFTIFPKISPSMKNIIDLGYANAEMLSKKNIRYGYIHNGKKKGWLPYNGKHDNSIIFAIGKQIIWKDINTPYDENCQGVENLNSSLKYDENDVVRILEQVNINKRYLIEHNHCPFCGYYPLSSKFFGYKECKICETKFR